MTVFKYFFKILKSYRVTLIMYTVILVVFAIFSLQTAPSTSQFAVTKPAVVVLNEDGNSPSSTHLLRYIEQNATIKQVEKDLLDDSLFYRDVHLVVTIPKGYDEWLQQGNQPEIKIQSSLDADASYLEMLLSSYLKTVHFYQQAGISQEDLYEKIDLVLEEQSQVQMMSSTDTNALEKATFFYNFANYSILAGCIFIVAMVLYTFNEEKIRKRNLISATSQNSLNRSLYFGNAVFVIFLWLLYVGISFVLVGKIMWSTAGLWYIVNSFVFNLCALSLGFLIGNLIHNKEAINGIVNVIALGSSFLCGCFVPREFLPPAILNFSRILPSFWYTENNQLIQEIEQFNWNTIFPLLQNMGIVLAFSIFFFVLTNWMMKKKRKFC